MNIPPEKDRRTDEENLEELHRRRRSILQELACVEGKITSLESSGQLEIVEDPLPKQQASPGTPQEKVALFLSLFGTRRSVYPKYWENPKTGKKGYSPACDNEWRPGICRKPQVKCAECPHQRFPSLEGRAIEAHLRGQHTLGVYAIREDNTCLFLAADFDGDGWQENVTAYCDAALRCGLTVAVERSRSGNGGHAWIFFREPLPAPMARQLGTLLLARASAWRPGISLDTYDRLFPNQDMVPAGGFGNLIALPLAKDPRQKGNTVFLDQEFRPFDDQWAFLATVSRLSRLQLDKVLAKFSPLVPLESTSGGEPEFALRSDEAALDLSAPSISGGLLSGEITLRLDAKLHVPRSLPTPILASLKRRASLANPIFHEKLRLRFPTFNTPRFLFAGEWQADRLVLPRACLDSCVSLRENAGASVVVLDQRDAGARVRWKFKGTLRREQQSAVKTMAVHDYGVLCAPPGAGKTVMGCALIARHQTSTLVLVHRTVLLDQWRDTAMHFLGLKKNEIGTWKGPRPRLTHRLDLAMMQTLTRVEDLAAVYAGYGLVLIDECHHIPATSFEALLKACPTRRVIGLTATPMRKDRLEKLLYLQCGPIRHTMSTTEVGGLEKIVTVQRTSFAVPNESGMRVAMHEMWAALIADEKRISVIAADIANCIKEGRSPLVLADRKAYLEKLDSVLAHQPNCTTVARYRLEGGLGKKERREIRQRLEQHYLEKTPFVLLATASFIGEGFDLPQLDTLVLAMPLSFKGRLIQYAGRISRTHEGKAAPRIYDYLDESSPITQAMFRRRCAGYHQLGFRVQLDGSVGDETLL